jgi:hypothetical protein
MAGIPSARESTNDWLVADSATNGDRRTPERLRLWRVPSSPEPDRDPEDRRLAQSMPTKATQIHYVFGPMPFRPSRCWRALLRQRESMPVPVTLSSARAASKTGASRRPVAVNASSANAIATPISRGRPAQPTRMAANRYIPTVSSATARMKATAVLEQICRRAKNYGRRTCAEYFSRSSQDAKRAAGALCRPTDREAEDVVKMVTASVDVGNGLPTCCSAPTRMALGHQFRTSLFQTTAKLA